MRVLIDIVHPANVLFFLNPIRIMQERGDELLILSRHKDVACDLLDRFRLKHTPVSTAGHGRTGLARELLVRDLAVLRAARRFRPHVMIGFGGIAISHAGKVLQIPSVSFYDTETATLQTRITWPFIDHLYVPEAYAGPVPAKRTRRFPGIKELSYLHPDNFTPSREIALANGLDPDRDNFIVRVVSWRANHDLGKSGWLEDTLHAVVRYLADRGRVHISSERPLPADLHGYRYTGSIAAIHHLLAHCRLYVGESATMAAETAVLGVPAIYDGRDHPGCVVELEKHGLLQCPRGAEKGRLIALLDRTLLQPATAQLQRRHDYIAVRRNLAHLVVEALDRHAHG